MSRKALDGITVLDFSQHMAGPAATMYLADFGARVIKIEPLNGDHSRGWGSYHFGENGDLSGAFAAVNRNKHSIAIDLKSDQGIEIVRRLAANADVVLEAYVPGAVDRLGIGYDSLREVRPDLIYCSLSGFGQNGPMAQRGGFDQLLQAYAGPMSITGSEGGDPVRIGPSAIDMLTGAHAAIGIMAALAERRISGEGQKIDTSLYDATLHMMGPFITEYSGSKVLPKKFGARFPQAAPYGLFDASDRPFFLGIPADPLWQRFCVEAGFNELLEDPRFTRNRDRVNNSAALYAFLEPAFAAQTAEYWTEIAFRARVPASVVNDVSEVVQHEQAKHREMLIEVDSEAVAAGLPIKLSGSPATINWHAPSLGAHTHEVLTAAGYDAAEIEKLEQAGLVR